MNSLLQNLQLHSHSSGALAAPRRRPLETRRQLSARQARFSARRQASAPQARPLGPRPPQLSGLVGASAPPGPPSACSACPRKAPPLLEDSAHRNRLLAPRRPLVRPRRPEWVALARPPPPSLARRFQTRASPPFSLPRDRMARRRRARRLHRPPTCP